MADPGMPPTAGGPAPDSRPAPPARPGPSELAELDRLRATLERQRSEIARQRDEMAALTHNLHALKESEGRWRILSGATLAGVYVLQDAKLIYVNSQAAQILGYGPDDLIGTDVLDLVVPEHRPLVEQNMRLRIEGGVGSIRYSVRMIHKSGAMRDVEVFGSRAVFDGKPAIIGTILDRSDERRAERAREAVEARFHAFMENTPLMAFMRDSRGRFLYANHAFRELLGRDQPVQILGKTPADFFPAEVTEKILAGDAQVLATGAPLEAPLVIQLPGQEPRHFHVLKFPLEDAESERLVGAVAFDMTEHRRAEASLAEQRRILQSILDSMGDGVAAADDQGKFFIFNPAARRITGLGPMGTTPSEWVQEYGVYAGDGTTPLSPEDLPLGRAIRGQSADSVELFLRNPAKPNGTWVTVSGRPLVDDRGSIRGGVVVFRDTTEIRDAMTQIRRAEAKYRALVEQLPVVTYISGASPEGPVHYMSPQIELLIGDAPEAWISDPKLWGARIDPEDRARVYADLERSAATGERFVCEYRMRTRDGHTVWVHDEAVPVADRGAEPVLFQGVLLDITERVTERGRRERLQALSMDLVAVQEAERRRIGLELHDEIGQILTGIKLQLGASTDLSREQLEQRLIAADGLVHEAIQHVRDLSQNLRPTVLDDLGLLPALVSYLGRYSAQTGVRVQFEHRGIERRRFLPDIETAAYRIVQEALTNVARHARARTASVRAWADHLQLGVQIEDDGTGFDATLAQASARTRGLAGMRERAALLHGHLTVESEPGVGCRVTGEIPLDESGG